MEIPRITDVKIEKRDACEKTQILTWEQRHGVYLPEDMKRFFLSTDGLYLHWSFQYTGIEHLVSQNVKSEMASCFSFPSVSKGYTKSGLCEYSTSHSDHTVT